MAVEPTTKHCRLFDNHGVTVNAVAVFPDGRMATKSQDGMIRLWSWENGRVLNEIKWKASKNDPGCLAISPDGRMIASGEDGGFVMAWDGTGKLLPGLPQAFKGHDGKVASLDFSPDCATLATASRVGSSDGVKLYNTQTWQPAQGKPITTKRAVSVRYSPSGEFLAIATHIPSVEIWNLSTGELIAHPIPRTPLSDHWFSPLQWTPDGTRVLTSGVGQELRTIAVWDLQNWTLGGPWRGHTGSISAIAVNRSGTLVASAADGRHPTKSSDSTVRLWRLSDGENIAIFQHSDIPTCVTFSVDGKYILSGGKDKKIAEWAVPADALPEDDRHGQDSDAKGQDSDAKGQDSDAKGQDSDTKGQGSGTKGSDTKRQHSDPKILVMNTVVRDACIDGDLDYAEKLLMEEIDVNCDSYNSYANLSFVRARKLEWDDALWDATKSIKIRPSLMGYISKGIALCGKNQVENAKLTFPLAFEFTDGNPMTKYFIFLTEATALFNADRHAEAIDHVQELAASSGDVDTTFACGIADVYMYVQLGTKALEGSRPNPKAAAGHFTTAVNACASLSKSATRSKYEDFVVLFGWNLESLCQSAHKGQCYAFLRSGRLAEAFEAYRYTMNMSDETTEDSYLAWSTGFMKECRTLYSFNGSAPMTTTTAKTMKDDS